ncbi:membrane-associated protease RseP (regulator of RpoE activity) [Microbacterium endophyticum]|uniref:Membrane-associated protease RseP (Regulator of RpoE activity) n=1 Tax=Microbacterium endophyticum TaxID=1526412 RepID=A0A7W4V366_9MICO|nr:site-2 protease family protein [Microbacterium endophyticum]MBB2976002.1 membrane-associated protease RseP (regulator of RpoE activity) [Microbacterium endophyticum]NIK35079.1 membrane-associated protease RseP (regulator of RpoE activity) [Microbacterium endophyticum]
MTVIAFVIGIVVLVVGLAVSIAVHELGHLAPAKAFGVRVGQYMIGFGPTLWSRRKGETEYGFKALPLGGYISMAGMYPPSPAEREREAAAKPARKTRFFSTMVQEARMANDETLGDDNRVFYKLPVWKRVVVMLGGPFMNLVMAVLLLTILYSGIGVQTATTTVASVSACVPAEGASECAATDPVAPAGAAGFEAGDVILSVDGTSVTDFAEASAIIQDSPGRAVAVVVERDGATQTLTLTPAVREVDGEEVGFAGITSQVDYVRQPVWTGAAAAVENTGAVIGVVAQLPVKVYDTAVSLFTGADRDPDGPLSIVGAGVIAGEVASADAPILNRVAGIIQLLASLNIALFVFNLIPLLPLDGGHIAVALWDGIKKTWAKLFARPAPKPVDATKLVPVTFVVVILLFAMGAILIVADLVNPLSIF